MEGRVLLMLSALVSLCFGVSPEVASMGEHYVNRVHRNNTVTEYHMYKLKINQNDELKSPEFPFCCTDAFYTIKCLRGDGPACYIRLLFSDLDLSKGSILHVFDGETAESPMFQDQPELRRGVWFRPAIASTGSSIYLKFIYHRLRTGDYTGFKAHFYATNVAPRYWHTKPTSDGCGLLKDVIIGESVSLTLPRSLDLGWDKQDEIQQDCVWLLKVPSFPPMMEAYARLTELNLFGYLEVREGTSSEGKLIYGGGDWTMYDLDSDQASLMGPLGFNSSKGLYIRLEVENSKDNQKQFSFVYGVFQKAEFTKKACSFHDSEGIPCKVDDAAWCLPQVLECNHVDNCPDGSDELNCPPKCLEGSDDCLPGHDIVETPAGCPSTRPFRCGDNFTCLPYSMCCDGHVDCDDQSDELDCEVKCKDSEKKCEDNTCVYAKGRCLEEECPIHLPLSCRDGRCFMPNYKCDSACDCSDCDDEDGCSKGIPKEMWVYGFVVIPLMLVTILLYVGCNKAHKMWIKQQRKEFYRESIRHARAASANSHSSHSSHQRHSQRSNASARYASLPVVREESVENGTKRSGRNENAEETEMKTSPYQAVYEGSNDTSPPKDC